MTPVAEECHLRPMSLISTVRVSAGHHTPKLASSDASLHVSLKEGLTVFRSAKPDKAHLEIPLSKLSSELGKGADFAKGIKSVKVGASYLQKDTELKATVKNGKLQLDIPDIRSGALGNNPLRAVVNLNNGLKALLETGLATRFESALADAKKVKTTAEVQQVIIHEFEASLAQTQKDLAKAQHALESLQKGHGLDILVGRFEGSK